MHKSLIPLAASMLFWSVQSPAAFADQFESTATTGDMFHNTQDTGTQGVNDPTTLPTNTQTSVNNPTRTTQLGGIFGGVTRNGLPATSMDSFVYEAGENKDLIYGDEGTDDIPPYFEFDKSHRIERGITDLRAQALTTGHSEYLPDAWGGDEWTGNEWDVSGNGSDVIPPYQGGLNFGQGGLTPTVPNLITQNSAAGPLGALEDLAPPTGVAIDITGSLDNLVQPSGVAINVGGTLNMPSGDALSFGAGF